VTWRPWVTRTYETTSRASKHGLRPDYPWKAEAAGLDGRVGEGERRGECSLRHETWRGAEADRMVTLPVSEQENIRGEMPGAAFEYPTQLVEGEAAFLE
jgi:hypothetical protein